MEKEALQDAEYEFPYHHVTDISPFTLSRYLFWGHAYASYMERVIQILSQHKFESVIDIGCGDGKLLLEMAKRFKGKKLFGTDFSPRAIAFAKAFAPSVEFTVEMPQQKFDAFTLIEVLEHVPPEQIPTFMADIREHLNPGGVGVITVPSDVKPIQAKHYQHFNEKTLRAALEPHFKVLSVSYINKNSALIRTLLANRFFILNERHLKKLLYRIYRKFYLNAKPTNGLRVLAVVTTP